MILYKKGVTPAAESLQFSADQRAGAETLIHVMTDIFAWYGRSFLDWYWESIQLCKSQGIVT